jgi:hypothetical protein
MNAQVASVAYSMYSNKGAFALLLGSGVSRSAGVPSKQEIALDLIRQIAVIENSSCEPDPMAWFVKQFGEKPDYSNVLEFLTGTKTERTNILRKYIEPNETDRENGLKRPTLAHQMIAQLVGKGYVKVIVTTTLDRLTENALRCIGIEPQIISCPDQLESALPIIHSKVTIIKTSGDYLNTGSLEINNGADEYGNRLRELLQNVFDNFGLITCGWSANGDEAIREVLKDSGNMRYSSYFACLTTPSQKQEKLARIRKAKTVTIASADSFFKELHEKITALETSSPAQLAAPQVALAKLKKYILNEEHIILLHDLIREEVDRMNNDFSKLPVHGTPTKEEIKERVDYYFKQCDTLATLFANGVYWGKEQHHATWLNSLACFTSAKERESEGSVWQDLETLPGLILLYSIGLASILKKDYRLLSAMFSMTSHLKYGEAPILDHINTTKVVDYDTLRKALGNRQLVPMSELLFLELKPLFTSLLPHSRDYENLFDMFEYLLALAHTKKSGKGQIPVGRFGYRVKQNGVKHPFEQIAHEFEASKAEETAFSPTLFKDMNDLKRTENNFKEYFDSLSGYYF